MVIQRLLSRTLIPFFNQKHLSTPCTFKFDVLDWTRSFLVVLCAVRASFLQIQIFEAIIALLVIPVMDEHWFKNQIACILPPHKVMLVNILSTVSLAGVILWCKYKFIWSIVHVPILTQRTTAFYILSKPTPTTVPNSSSIRRNRHSSRSSMRPLDRLPDRDCFSRLRWTLGVRSSFVS